MLFAYKVDNYMKGSKNDFYLKLKEMGNTDTADVLPWPTKTVHRTKG